MTKDPITQSPAEGAERLTREQITNMRGNLKKLADDAPLGREYINYGFYRQIDALCDMALRAEAAERAVTETQLKLDAWPQRLALELAEAKRDTERYVATLECIKEQVRRINIGRVGYDSLDILRTIDAALSVVHKDSAREEG